MVTVNTENEPSQFLPCPASAYVDAKLSGSLEKIHLDFGDISTLENLLHPLLDDANTDTVAKPVLVNNTAEQQRVKSATGSNIMRTCMVKLDRLSDTMISKWKMHKISSHTSSVEDGLELSMNQVGPYGLCIHPSVPRHTSRHDRIAKENVNY